MTISAHSSRSNIMTVSRIATFAATCHAMKAVKRMSDTLCKNSKFGGMWTSQWRI